MKGTTSGISTSASPLGHARPVLDRSDHLGDDVARLAHDDEVARAHVLCRDLVLVVQGGPARRWSLREDRFEAGEGSRPARPADRDHDVEQPGGALLGRELEGDGPPRRRDVARGRVQCQLVHLGDDAVDLVRHVVARRGDRCNAPPPRPCRWTRLASGLTGNPAPARVGRAWPNWVAAGHACFAGPRSTNPDRVGPEVQWPRGPSRRVLPSQWPARSSAG